MNNNEDMTLLSTLLAFLESLGKYSVDTIHCQIKKATIFNLLRWLLKS